MSVLSRDALESSPLSDLHEIAAEFSIDGYRRLRKADLIDKLLEARGGSDSAKSATKPAAKSQASGRGSESRSRGRGGRGAGGRGDHDETRGENRRREERERGAESAESVEGKLEIHASGSGFVHPSGGGAEVYVSAAQIRRLELSDGDTVGGPVRPPRRSERHPSLVRIEKINGKSADEVAPAPLARTKSQPQPQPVTLPTERFALGADKTLAEIDKVAPIGRGSRVVFHGGPHSGKSTAARALAGALRGLDGVDVISVLSGARAEEVGDWAAVEPASTETLDSSPDSRARSVERAIDKGKRTVAKGGNAVVIIDSVDDLPAAGVRKALAAAGIKPKGGSLTVVAVSRKPIGGETTLVAFDQAKASAGKFPSLDVRNSSALRPDLLLDGRGLKAYQKAHSDALKKAR